jgi:hypothetical protein
MEGIISDICAKAAKEKRPLYAKEKTFERIERRAAVGRFSPFWLGRQPARSGRSLLDA